MALLGCFLFACSIGFAQVENASEVVFTLDPSQFNLEGLHPGPVYHDGFTVSPVFWGANTVGQPGLRVTIRQWTDGTTTLVADTVSQSYNYQAGAGQTNKGSFSGQVNFGGSNAPVSGSVAGNISILGSTSGSQGWATSNALSFSLDGNLLSVNVIYTDESGVIRATTISLGTVTAAGGFIAFTDGFLTGKKIIMENDGDTLDTHTPHAPATADPFTNPVRGFCYTTGSQHLVQRLKGYVVTTGTQGGRVVGVTVEPVYEYVYSGFMSLQVNDSPVGGFQYQN